MDRPKRTVIARRIFVRAIALLAVFTFVFLCLPCPTALSVFAGGEDIDGTLKVAQEVYDSYGITPILPIASGTLTVSSIDYYYEDKDDLLPGLHGGIDFICSSGTEILAVCDGVVDHVGYSSSYGYNVILKHTAEDGSAYYSRYAHLKKYLVSVDQEVSAGEVIASSGNTGQSSTPHLHLEIYNTETKKVGRYERSYTLKFYLSQGTEILSRLKIYHQMISGTYNSQLRTTVLGDGSSCYARCGLDYEHDHISNYAEYIKTFFKKSGDNYIYNSEAEAALFSDATLKNCIYEQFDRDRDGHLSFCEAMEARTLDLRGRVVGSLDGVGLFSNLQSILDDDGEKMFLYPLSVSYSAPTEYITDAGLCGTYKHLDTVSGLNMREGPSTSYKKVGSIAPEAIFRVTEWAVGGEYTWGKTVYNGVEGWCVISVADWTAQISSTLSDYYIDADGTLRSTDTTEILSSYISDPNTAEGVYFDELFDSLPEGMKFVGWATEEGGDAVLRHSGQNMGDIFPQLLTEETSVTLYAVIVEQSKIGDVNCDGQINEDDIMSLLRYLSGYTWEEQNINLCDINGDGKVNNRDILALKKMLD